MKFVTTLRCSFRLDLCERFVFQLVANQTLISDRSSVSGARDVSQMSAIPFGLTEGFSSFEQGSTRNSKTRVVAVI